MEANINSIKWKTER